MSGVSMPAGIEVSPLGVTSLYGQSDIASEICTVSYVPYRCSVEYTKK